MSDQFDFDFDYTPISPELNGLTLAQRFEIFHYDNPHVYRNLVQLARQFREKRPDAVIGIQMLFEVLRWNYWINVDSEEQFKFPNAFAAGYSRLIMRNEPDLDGIFKLCKSTFDEE
jgi:hypothetical protein